jgi:hypothetical protein
MALITFGEEYKIEFFLLGLFPLFHVKIFSPALHKQLNNGFPQGERPGFAHI